MSNTIHQSISCIFYALILLVCINTNSEASFNEVLNQVRAMQNEFNRRCIVTDISADGTTVAGYKTEFYPENDNTKFRPFLWKKDKLINLPLGEYQRGKVSDLSADGNIAVGFALPMKKNSIAVRWVAGKFEKLEGFSDRVSSAAYQVSADGKINVVNVSPSQSLMERQSFVGENGKYKKISLPTSIDTVPIKMSGDGKTIVGNFIVEKPFHRAFHWQNDTFQKITLDPKWSSAVDVSHDGSVIIGTLGAHNNTIYLQKKEGTLLFRLQEGKTARWVNLSGDGKVMVATISDRKLPKILSPIASIDLLDNKTGQEIKSYISNNGIDPTTLLKFLAKVYVFWERENWAPTELAAILDNSENTMSDWNLEYVVDISQDGNVLVGMGAYQGKSASWIIHLPSIKNRQYKAPTIKKIC